jgi:hypothetical protein
MKRAMLVGVLAAIGISVGAGAAAMAGARSSTTLDWSRVQATLGDGETETVHRTTMVDGGEWRFSSHENRAGETCISQTVPGEGVGRGCIDTSRIFADGAAVLAMPGARQRVPLVEKGLLGWHNLWIYGFVRPDVASLEVINMDCSAEAIPFDEQGAFVHVVGLARITAGAVPYEIRARNAAGEIVHDQNVSVNVPPTARDAGLEKLVPGAECR